MEHGDGPRVVLDGLAFVESARWHEGRFWFAHWSVGEIIATDLEGNSEVVAAGRQALGWSIDWLPDGRLLVTGESLMRQEPDGSFVQHADLSAVARHNWNEIVVDPQRGNLYVNGADTSNFFAGQLPPAGIIAVVAADGTVRQVADEIDFPNGMVITRDGTTLVIAESMKGRLTAFSITADGSLTHRRVWADHVAPDGICIDAEDAIWCGAGDVTAPDGRGLNRPALRCGCAKAVRSSIASNSTGQASPTPSADRTATLYSSSVSTGAASTSSMRSSPSELGKPSASMSPTRPRSTSNSRSEHGLD
jgi:sugar lactone lactonase YvrE